MNISVSAVGLTFGIQGLEGNSPEKNDELVSADKLSLSYYTL